MREVGDTNTIGTNNKGDVENKYKQDKYKKWCELTVVLVSAVDHEAIK